MSATYRIAAALTACLVASACGGENRAEATIDGGQAIESGIGDHSCVIDGDGSIVCWGRNNFGQLGGGTKSESAGPTRVLGLTDAADLDLASVHGCAIAVEGETAVQGESEGSASSDSGDRQIHCWGQFDGPEPIAYPLDGEPIAVAAGSGHRCGVVVDGDAYCWGLNNNGQLNRPFSELESSDEPLLIDGLPPAVDVSAGGDNTCILTLEGDVWCWGSSFYGQLGVPSRLGAAVPLPIAGVTGAVAVEVGTVFACALLETSEVRCWGNNELGQLGATTEESSSFEPVTVAGIDNAIDLNSGDVHSCAALATGEVACWGHNARGQLRVDADVRWSTEPVLVDGITTATAVAAGGEHTCALLSDGQAQCWGSDEFDQS